MCGWTSKTAASLSLANVHGEPVYGPLYCTRNKCQTLAKYGQDGVLSYSVNASIGGDTIQQYVEQRQHRALRERLFAGYQTNAAADVALAAEWSEIEAEAYR